MFFGGFLFDVTNLQNSFCGCVCCGISASSVLGQATEQTTTGRDRQSVNITVYNSNLGLVRETRSLTLSQGQVALRFADVRPRFDPRQFHLSSLTAPASLRSPWSRIIKYDLLIPAKLLDKFVGKEIPWCCGLPKQHREF